MRLVLLEVRGIGGCNLRLRRGDLVAILGPPGTGKSALLRILAFHDPPVTGDLRWRGRLVTGLPPEALPVLLLQRPASLPPQLPACELLLLDEPAPGLLPDLPALASGGVAVVVATTDPEIALWCSVIYRIDDGRLRLLGAET